MTAEIDYFAELERQAWQSYERARSLYHISPMVVTETIAIEGIKASIVPDEDPTIWFFTDKKWAGEVAASIGMRHFALHRIRKSAIERETIRWDNVAEWCAAVSFYCLKAHIPKNYVSFVGYYSLSLDPKDWVHP